MRQSILQPDAQSACLVYGGLRFYTRGYCSLCGKSKPGRHPGMMGRRQKERLDTIVYNAVYRKRHSIGFCGEACCKALTRMDLSKDVSSGQCEKKRRELRFYLAFLQSLGYNNKTNGVEWGGRNTLTDVLFYVIGQAAINRVIALCEFRHYQCRFMRHLNLGEAAWFTGLPPSRSHHLAIFMRMVRLPQRFTTETRRTPRRTVWKQGDASRSGDRKE